MNSTNSQCDNCQLQEKIASDEHVTLKKLLSLKSKIFHTDALIRKFKEQKDENLRLASECEKSQSFCAKYEIDLKLALEELHSLRESEKEFKDCTSKLQSEIASLKETLQAEKALVKQYKCLVEKDEKSEVQVKDKSFKDLEKKLSKKDDELSKTKEKVRMVNKKLNFMTSSYFKALKFLRKIGNHPALYGVLPVVDRKALHKFCEALLNEKAFKTSSGYASDEDFVESEESQLLEDLLLESVPDESSVDSEISSRVASPVPPNMNQFSPVQDNVADSTSGLDDRNNKPKENGTNDNICSDNDEWEDVCEPTGSISSFNDMSSKSANSDVSSKKEATVPGNLFQRDEVIEERTSISTVLIHQDSGKLDDEATETISENADENGESPSSIAKSIDRENDQVMEPILDSAEIALPAIEDTVGKDIVSVQDESVNADLKTECANMDIDSEDDPKDDLVLPSIVKNSDKALHVDLVNAGEALVESTESTDTPNRDHLDSRIEEFSLQEKNKNVFVASKVNSLPLIPFSEERQFQPGKVASPNASDPAHLIKDPSDLIKELIAETSVTEKADLPPKDNELKKLKKSVKHVSKICSRMKSTVLLERPVSPLPPSPPPTPTHSEKFDLDSSQSLPPLKPMPPKLVELFGSDSEGEDTQKQMAKGALQHQESEGFDPELESQEGVLEERSRRLDATLSKITETTRHSPRKHNELELYNNECAMNEPSVSKQYSRQGPFDQNNSRDKPFDQNNSRDRQCDRNPHPVTNTRLYTDVTMDKHSGRCKISIRLPDSLDSVSNVKLELDTFTRELHLDYGPSPSSDSNNSGQALAKTARSGLMENISSNPRLPPSPAISLMEDSFLDSSLCADDQPPKRTTDTPITRKSPFDEKRNLPVSSLGSVRRASAPAVGHTLKRLASEKKSVAFAKTLNVDQVTKGHVRPASPNDVFKTPALRSRRSLVSQNAFVEVRTESVNTEMESVRTETEAASKAKSSDEKLQESATEKPVDNIETSISTRTRQKRKFQTLCASTSEESLIKSSKSFTILSSDSVTVKQAKYFHNSSESQPKINTRILNALKRLEELQGNDDNDSMVIFHLISDFCNPNLMSEQEEFVDSAIFYFSRSKADVLSKFESRQKYVKPILTLREECFVSLTKRLQDRKSSMKNLLEHFRTAISGHLMRSAAETPAGSACLCRLHASFSRLEGNVKAPRALCYNLLLKKHPLAPYLVANLLIVWPMILLLYESSVVHEIWKKVFSWVLFRKSFEKPVQEVLTRKVLLKMANLELPGADFKVDTLVEQIFDTLMKLQEDSKEAESVCQQLLLLSSYEDWSWTKTRVLSPLFDLLTNIDCLHRPSLLRLLGSFLQLCLPGEKEDVDLMVHKLQEMFKKLDDKEVSSKAACVQSLLNHSDRLDPGTSSLIRKWVQVHKRSLSNVFQEDLALSAFLD